MNIGHIDLNLLVFFDALLHEKNVTRAASRVGLSQPAMSNRLRQLRSVFEDPILVKTNKGMEPTKRAREIQPAVKKILSGINEVLQPTHFKATNVNMTFRIMINDYAESTLLPRILNKLWGSAPGITLDIMTPSDVSFREIEQGDVDIAINHFDSIPQSFHQKKIGQDNFACVFNVENPILKNFTLENYLNASHIWVSKVGMGRDYGMNLNGSQQLGWVDQALAQHGLNRDIKIFSRNYWSAMMIAEQTNGIVTLPSKATIMQNQNPRIVLRIPPFEIPPIDLKMAWSPLLHHNPAHRWMRQLVASAADELN